jgi:nucleoside-diphosphate-sugar epimerase
MIGIFGYGYIGKNLKGEKVTLNEIDKCDKLYYLAAESQPGLKWDKYSENISLTLDVLKRIKPTCELVFTSTTLVYDSYGKINPKENYAVSKRICEDIITQAGKEGLKYQILRLTNVISKGVNYGAFYKLVEQAKDGYIEFYPGSYRPFITMKQAVQAIEMDKPSGTYNVTCPAIYIEDIIKLLSKKYKFDTKALKGEPLKIEPSWAEMKELGWNGRTSLENIKEILGD